MRRRIELYIDGALADLADDGLVLFNWAVTDLERPTAVRNSYSRQVTLPGTPANDAIFSHAYRTDRVSSSFGFDALSRTPFAIYADTGEVLQSGYLRLDSVKRKGPSHEYAVTLYGGLGEFLYNLMYNDDGTTRTLADMDYWFLWPDGSAAGTETQVSLTRTLNAAEIVNAWAAIDEDDPLDEGDATYRVLNYAPCYNGIPEEFDAAKALVYQPSFSYLPAELYPSDGGDPVYPYNDWGLAEFAEAADEWSMRDLRSYLQRPVLNVKAFLDSLSKSDNNGGYSVVWKVRPPSEGDLWMTLKRPTEVEWSSGTKTQTLSGTTAGRAWPSAKTTTIYSTALAYTGDATATLTITPLVDGVEVTDESGYLYEAWERETAGGSDEVVCGATLVQVVVRDSSGNAKYVSPVHILTNATNTYTAAEVASVIADMIGSDNGGYSFVPETTADDPVVVSGYYVADELGDVYTWNAPLSFSIDASRAAIVEIRYGRLSDKLADTSVSAFDRAGWNTTYGVADETAGFGGNYYSTFTGSASIVTSSVRSGVTFTQADFLRSDKSIGDYLLALGRMYGWLFTCDEAAKEVTVWSRNDFYSTGEDAIDLSERIDRGQDIDIRPLYASARIYNFAPEAVGGKAEEHLAVYGRVYGGQRVNTGYAFNDEAVNLTEGTALKTAVWSLSRGRAYSWITSSGVNHLPFEREAWSLTYGDPADTTTTETEQPLFSTAWTSYSTTLPFADLFGKAQFEDDGKKGVAGEDCLLYLAPRTIWKDNAAGLYQITDDTDDMYYLNGDKPCWILAFDDTADGCVAVDDGSGVPQFLPFKADGVGDYAACWLSFGIPAELYDPLITSWDESETFYSRYWKNYLGDLLDADTKVMTARVRLDGLQAGTELLRRFFWYEGSLWVLNKISNYSLTTADAVECEFVQVRDTDNYTSGQQW